MTQRQYLNMYKGALYSAHHNLNRFKPENLVKTRCDTPVQNLVQSKVGSSRHLEKMIFLGGQDILTCGIVSSITTGMMAAGHVLNKNLVIESETIAATL